MSFNSREIHKFVKNAVFTPDGGAAINLYGIKRVEPGETADTTLTQVANCIYPDESVTGRIDNTIRAVFEDVEKWNPSGGLTAGTWGVFVCDNEGHPSTGASDEVHTWSKVKIINVSTGLETANPQEVTVEMEVWSPTGTVHPLTKS